MYKQYKNYIKVICGALLLATGYENAMAPTSVDRFTCADRFIAFLSGGHGRLGQVSPVQYLDLETAKGICRLAYEKDVEIISEDETSLSVQLQQPEIPFDKQVILGPSLMHPARRRAGDPVRRDIRAASRRLFQVRPDLAVVQPFEAPQAAIHRQPVQQVPFRRILKMPMGDFQVTVSNIDGDLRKVCRLAVLRQIESLHVSQRSIIPVDIAGRRLQAVPLN
jgi:hypothetical protein